MLRVTLKEYQSRIEGLIGESRLPEAAAHCHLILQQYPRHIRTYRLFGRVLLDQKLYSDAIDVFSRVASADPDDLIANAGLSLAYREKEDLTMAIWHMERAFEVEPYNVVIQEEMRDLSARDGGIVRRRFGLNRAAMARVYFRGGLYPQATMELLALLAKSPDRLDLQVVLAETYYWDDSRVEAENQCLHILDQMPLCIKANAILADIWLQGGRFKEARECLSNLQSLTMLTSAEIDPNTTVGRALTAHPDIDLPEEIVVDALDEGRSGSTRFAYDTDWLQEIGVENENENEIEELDPIDAVFSEIGETGTEEAIRTEEEDDLEWLQHVVISEETPEQISDDQNIDSSPMIDESTYEFELVLDDAIDEADGNDHDQEYIQPSDSYVEQSDELEDSVTDLPSWSDFREAEGQIEQSPASKFQTTDWLEQIAPDSEINEELPDWLDDPDGLTSELEMPSDFALPEWLTELPDESIEHSKGAEGPVDVPLSQVPGDASGQNVEAKFDDLSLLSDDAVAEKAFTGQESPNTSANPSTDWTSENEDQADFSFGSLVDPSEDLGDGELGDAIPWLDDIEAGPGDEQSDRPAYPDVDESATDKQSEDGPAEV